MKNLPPTSVDSTPKGEGAFDLGSFLSGGASLGLGAILLAQWYSKANHLETACRSLPEVRRRAETEGEVDVLLRGEVRLPVASDGQGVTPAILLEHTKTRAVVRHMTEMQHIRVEGQSVMTKKRVVDRVQDPTEWFQNIPFMLRDKHSEDGIIINEVNEAEIAASLTRTFHKYEKNSDVKTFFEAGKSAYQTVGREISERALSIGTHLTAAGKVRLQADGETLVLCRPFVLTRDSPQGLISKDRRTWQPLQWAGGVLVIGGLALTAYTLVAYYHALSAQRKLTKKRSARSRRAAKRKEKRPVDQQWTVAMLRAAIDDGRVDAHNMCPWQRSNLPKLELPNSFLCPISLVIMDDPVVAQDGRTYDRANIQRWMDSRPERVTSPITNVPLESRALFPNHDLKSQIVTFIESWGRRMNARRGKVAPPSLSSLSMLGASETETDVGMSEAELSEG